MCHGSCILFPSDQFDADAVLKAIYHEKDTALLGVPTMFIAELDANQRKGYKIDTLCTDIAAGSAVPVSLMKRLQHEMSVDESHMA
jgi:acyl-CoA synthetase (AMP-forming)/AMP-acid ligase II